MLNQEDVLLRNGAFRYRASIQPSRGVLSKDFNRAGKEPDLDGTLSHRGNLSVGSLITVTSTVADLAEITDELNSVGLNTKV